MVDNENSINDNNNNNRSQNDRNIKITIIFTCIQVPLSALYPKIQ